MCQLQVWNVRRVTAFGNGYDMIYASWQWVRIFQWKINRLTTDTANCLGSVDFLLVDTELLLVWTASVWSWYWHCIPPCNAKATAKCSRYVISFQALWACRLLLSYLAIRVHLYRSCRDESSFFDKYHFYLLIAFCRHELFEQWLLLSIQTR